MTAAQVQALKQAMVLVWNKTTSEAIARALAHPYTPPHTKGPAA